MSNPTSLADAARPELGILPVTLNTGGTAAAMFVDAGGSAIVASLSPAGNAPIDSDSSSIIKVYQNKPFDLKCWGRFTGGTTTNLTIRVMVPTTGGNQISATDANNTALFSSGAVAVNSVSGNWMLESELIWDITGLKIAGVFWGWIQGSTNTAVTQAVATPFSLTAANFAAAGLPFGIDAAFSAGNAGNKVMLDGFDIDPL